MSERLTVGLLLTANEMNQADLVHDICNPAVCARDAKMLERALQKSKSHLVAPRNSGDLSDAKLGNTRAHIIIEAACQAQRLQQHRLRLGVST